VARPREPFDIVIERTYRGPPHAGNGGYVAGLLAESMRADPDGGGSAGPVRVRLHRPAPLDVALQIVRNDSGAELRRGDGLLASAVPATLDLEPRPSLPLDAARALAERYPGFAGQPFDGCFVCGASRPTSDGLRVFVGRDEDRDLFAGAWTVPARLFEPPGRALPPRYIWAVLDCPGGWALQAASGKAYVLGEFTVDVSLVPRPRETCVVSAWEIGRNTAEQPGRKRRCGSALHGADGRLMARAEATWIEVAPDSLT
jgi:hypothetical protein